MSGKALNIQNKKAKFEYHLVEQFTAGIQLKGTEIKSIRNGKASIMEAYGVFSGGEVFIRNMYIAAYENGSYNNHQPRTDRKLLLNAKEIAKIEKFLKTKGNALVPVKLFLSDKGWLKILISCATGKKTHDKRQDLKFKEDRREMDRVMKRNR